MTIIPETFRAL